MMCNVIGIGKSNKIRKIITAIGDREITVAQLASELHYDTWRASQFEKNMNLEESPKTKAFNEMKGDVKRLLDAMVGMDILGKRTERGGYRVANMYWVIIQ